LLAGELSKVETSEEFPAALERYENFFRPIVEPNQRMPPGAMQMMNPQTSWGISILNTILWSIYKTRVYRLFGGFGVAGAKDEELPEYGWPDQ
jgi:hypothetical protein